MRLCRCVNGCWNGWEHPESEKVTALKLEWLGGIGRSLEAVSKVHDGCLEELRATFGGATPITRMVDAE